MKPFVHLHVHSPYSFLDGASSIRELLARAAEEGQPGLALTDVHSLAGAVEALQEGERQGLRVALGAEIFLEPLAFCKRGGPFPLVLLALGPRGHRQLSRLLTESLLAFPEKPRVTHEMLSRALEGAGEELFLLTGGRRGELAQRLLRGDREGAKEALRALLRLLPRTRGFLPSPGGKPSPFPLAVELVNPLYPGGQRLQRELFQLAEAFHLPPVAANDVRYARPEAYPVYDVMVCIREGIDVSVPHPERPLNAQQDLKGTAEMARLFSAYPLALQNAALLGERALAKESLSLREDRSPRLRFRGGELFLASEEDASSERDAFRFLQERVYEGALERYGAITEEVRRRLDHELQIIGKLNLASYFLLVWDVARFARKEGIRFAGRGSAADSAVAYCLGITHVDAIGRGLLFERFLSPERSEKPDIDIDFDARRRDEVSAYLRKKYGEDHVVHVATWQTFRGRLAIREAGKALGMEASEWASLARRLPYMITAKELPEMLDAFPELREGDYRRPRYRLLLEVARGLAGLPRHAGTHVGGVVISHRPVAEILPVQMAAKGVPILQADKEGVEALGLVKLDLLSLRTLSAVGVAEENGSPPWTAIPPEDPLTYAMIREGRTVGVFQLESSAQRALQVRLGAETMEDLVASVALIRPGPIKGNMVDPYVKRRRGEEPVTYLHPLLEPILKKTYGVVLFQEQVIDIAQKIAGFTAGEADRLRRTMSRARSLEEMAELGKLFVEKAKERGVQEEVARAIFQMLEGYASYGFNEAHAAAFADIAYRTAWLARHRPEAYFAALLSLQPMGYYPPHTLAVEARSRGVAILRPDVNRSEDLCTVEGKAIRLGLSLIRHLSEKGREALVKARPFASLREVFRLPLDRQEKEALILSGALDGLSGGKRRPLLWLLERQDEGRGFLTDEGLPEVSDFSLAERIWGEGYALGLFVTAHPLSLWRERLQRKGYTPSWEMEGKEHGETVKVAGLLVRPHRPPTRSGRIVVYFALEDEGGLVDVVMPEPVYQAFGAVIFGETSPLVAVRGRVERREKGVQVVADEVASLSLYPR